MSQHSSSDGSRSSLNRLFAPTSIALIGATERSVWSVSAVDNLQRFGYSGRIHMVNPKGGLIFGKNAATSCTAIGESVDAALMMVPESKMEEAFDDLRQAGVGGAVVLSAGFAELGAEGAQRQQRMLSKARAAGIRMLGPNCLGFANFTQRAAIWTTPLRRPMPNAQLAVVSQSGAVAGQLEQFAYQQRIGLTHLISTGNEADIEVADVIDYLAQQPEPRAIALFLESVRDPLRFRRAVIAAQRAGKPIVVLKVGASEATVHAAQAHTGALVGNDRVFDAVCQRLGLARAYSLEELIVSSDLFARIGPLPDQGIALAAMSGGLCEIANDQAEVERLPFATLAPATMGSLRDTLPPLATPANPLDLTGAAMLEPELISRALPLLGHDAGVGLVGFVFDAPQKEDARGMARRFITEVGTGLRASGKPALMMSHAFSVVSAEARQLCEDTGVVYSGGGLRHCLHAITQLRRRGAWKAPSESADLPLNSIHTRPHGERGVLDHLAAYGVPVIPAQLVQSADDAVAAARNFDATVVLKIASADIPHKTEVGGVVLGLRGDDAVRAGFERLLEKVTAAKPDARIDGVIVSPMREAGIELLIGVVRDPQWGLTLAVGLGGIWVEALRDTSLRLLPVDRDEARAMLDELRATRLLDGFRGMAPVDRNALADTMVAVGQAALALGPELDTLEINPLRIDGSGRIEALDGLCTWNTPDASC